MSSKLPKKLHLPAKKAWKSFKFTLQTKLTKLNISTTLKRTKKYCISAFNLIYHLIPRKLYALTSRSSSSSSSCSHYHFQYYRQQNQYKPSFSAIYIDELFPGQHDGYYSFANPIKAKEEMVASINMEKKHDEIGSSSSGLKKIDERKIEKRKTETGETSSSRSCGGGGDGNARKLPFLPQFRGVDERAEEFISKFREEMKLEREKSIIDFQEMLARSS